MAHFNPIFWEIQIDTAVLERMPASGALWFETETDREHRHAMRAFFEQVGPLVETLIDTKLTRRQREVVRLYYYHGKTQEDIAAILNLTQSTVSRHLFGTARGGKKVGGALLKLQKAVNGEGVPGIDDALETLQELLAQPA